MAKFAYPSPFAEPNEIIDAATLTLHDKRVFYCTTPECQARMYLRNPQKNSACRLKSIPKAIQDDECIAQCELTSVGKQICRGDQ